MRLSGAKKELAEGGHMEAQCSLGDYYSEGCYIEAEEPAEKKTIRWQEGCIFSWQSIEMIMPYMNWEICT